MSLRELPEIKALEAPSSITFEPDQGALAKWRPEIHAAIEQDNTISILDMIGESFDGEGVTAKRIGAALRRIGSQDVVVNVNSPGGDFFEGIAIYNMLRQHPHRVTVKVLGLAASAASVVAMAGDEIQISDVGFLMVHNAWALAIGNRHDLREAAAMLEPFDDAMASLYARRAGVTRAVAAEWMDGETWMNGETAVDVGLADSILPDAEIDAAASAEMKVIAAVRRVEASLRRQGLSSREAKALIAEVKGGARDAAPTSAKRDAGIMWQMVEAIG